MDLQLVKIDVYPPAYSVDPISNMLKILHQLANGIVYSFQEEQLIVYMSLMLAT